VEFVSDIAHDLSRRDFTVNAMAMREDGSLVDPFGGRNDLDRKLLRTVNKPFERYNEDPLRMLRAARFVAQLGFTAESQTERQAAKKAEKILEVSKERWVQELDKLLLSAHPELGLHFLARTGLINFIIPEIGIQIGYNQDSPYHQLELWDHTVKTVSLTPNDIILRWAALLHDIGKPYVRTKNQRGYSNYVAHELVGSELVEKIGWYLKWPRARTQAVSQLVKNRLEPDSPLREADAAATQA
jgi:tRNA nucleotidyltransferase (CCA-adding enzyme)